MKSKPVRFVMSILAAVNAAVALGTLGDLISPTALAWLILVSVAVQAGTQFWVEGQVTPIANPKDRWGRPLVAAQPVTPPE